MSVKVMSWVFEHSAAELGDRLVLLALADCASDEGTNAFPSVRTLTGKTRMSERAVRYSLRNLETAGLILTETNAGRGNANRYTLLMGADNAGADFAGGGNLRPEGGQNPTETGADTAPNPSLTRTNPRARARCPVHLADLPCRGCAADRKVPTEDVA